MWYLFREIKIFWSVSSQSVYQKANTKKLFAFLNLIPFSITVEIFSSYMTYDETIDLMLIYNGFILLIWMN